MNSLIDKFGKIVFHFDGNNNDPDDIAAMPIAAMLVNSANLQDDAAFFYGNNLSEKNEDFKVEKMRKSAKFAEKLGIDTFDYQSNIGATTDELVKIFNSGEKVLSIEGGPMEAVYRALAKTSSQNRQNITLLSHSWWNENRDVINRPGFTKARTWDDLKKDFPEVTFIDIDDQNPGFYNDGWNWLDKKNDPVLKEARELMILSNKRNDPSDAGMLFYALTGKENASPYDAKTFFEANPPSWSNGNDKPSTPPPTPSPSPEQPSNPLIVEAENMMLSGEYRIENNPFASNDKVISLYSGDGDNDDTGAASFDFAGSTGVYTIKVNYFDENDGVGQMKLIQNDNMIASWNLDRQLGSNLADGKTKTFLEFENIEVSAGDEFRIEGMEQGNVNTAEHARLDGLEFIPQENISSPPSPSSPSSPPSSQENQPWHIEAENTMLSGDYHKENNSFASNGKVISLYSGDGNNNDSGAASFDFEGGTGLYNIIIDTFDENDGVGQIDIEQNGNQLASFKLDRQLGSQLANNQTKTSLEISDVLVSSGDEFRIEGMEQGNIYTGEHTRIDAFHFVPISDA